MTKLVLAYDRSPTSFDEMKKDFAIIEPFLPSLGAVKIGLEAMNARLRINKNGFYTTAGLAMALEVANSKGAVLWDEKFHDIGCTMARAVRNLADARRPPMGITVHASSSIQALKAAAEARNAAKTQPILFGVTLLTDTDETECQRELSCTSLGRVAMLARKIADAGFDGIVCSGKELDCLRRLDFARPLVKLVPGIRPAWAASGDQKRVVTPREAVSLGADYIVVGRPVWDHPDPAEAVHLIHAEIAEALGTA